MIFNITLQWPVDIWQMEKVYNFSDVRGDTIVFNFKIFGLNLTNYSIRGEVYDLNVSNRLANDLAFPKSAPEIILTHASNEYSTFTATVTAGLTSVMQTYGQVEFEVTSASGVKSTILQQAIHLAPQRIIWSSETQAILENNQTGENELF